MPSIRLATFNVENLFSRPVFWDGRPQDGHQIGNVFFNDPVEGRAARRIAEAVWSDAKCQLTALALLAARADIVCLQEVDNEAALRTFRKEYINRLDGPAVGQWMKAYLATHPLATREEVESYRKDLLAKAGLDHFAVLEGNDGRGIDVGILARPDWVSIKSHADKTFEQLGAWLPGMATYTEKRDGQIIHFTPQDRVFKRDCLEVEFNIGGVPFTVFTCHFKSMSDGREASRVMREAEATAVRRIVSDRFGGKPELANWAICGDLNDYVEIDGDTHIRSFRNGEASPPGILPLFAGGFSHNIVSRLPPGDRWTSYHAPDDVYAQLDYILLSPALAARNPFVKPEIIRSGQPWRATRYAGQRFPGIGWQRPKASDHCVIVVELAL